ncbi:5-deoxy-glucuronate isomerase [Limnochorda pilosa]|uniref:Myo-inositol catabolism protein n=1 Tax=Limnochorda pilosa TaxID=1555112 RepID=A0A0K2SIM5_LIMPI|nr:5-deoxy-glucuronate isomerase [Limnochorda pilosa]BAS26877.1 myo-inositol catabolism protein [Limnochorda pilosa]
MNLRIRKPLGDGLTPLVDRPMEGIERIHLFTLRLGPGQAYTWEGEPGRESGLVLLQGGFDLEAGGERVEGLGPRPDVFSAPATAVYLQPGAGARITAGTEGVELAVATAPVPVGTGTGNGRTGGGVPGRTHQIVTPQDIITHRGRGGPHFTRDVFDVIGSQVPAASLIVGETFNRSGEWSSYPPHKHDRHRPPEEVKMEEVYFFRFRPRTGFALQRIYTEDRSVDEAYVVEQDDCMLLPKGYHPVAAAPGYVAYYLWVLAGEGRELRPYDDPTHAWVGRAGAPRDLHE